MKTHLLRVISIFVLLAAACGDDTAANETTTTAPAALTNACPVDGCSITITGVEPEAGELRVSWTANFAPDFSKNHLHLYWDTYTAEQVSADAESEHGVVQGNWLPTDEVPTVLTTGAVSVAMREESTTLCATAADFDHIVLNTSLVQCLDVSASL